MAGNLRELIFGTRNELVLFHLLDEAEVEKIVPFLEVVDYPKGTTIFHEGEPGDSVGFVTSGVLEVKKQTEFKDRQIVIAIVGKGSFVGELALVDPKHTRSATVVAIENSELIILRYSDLEAIIAQYPVIAVKILKGLNHIMALRMQKSMERLAAIF